MISTSSGVPVYTAATLVMIVSDQVGVRYKSQRDKPRECGAKINTNNETVVGLSHGAVDGLG
jgi:hypothetical protein